MGGGGNEWVGGARLHGIATQAWPPSSPPLIARRYFDRAMGVRPRQFSEATASLHLCISASLRLCQVCVGLQAAAWTHIWKRAVGVPCAGREVWWEVLLGDSGRVGEWERSRRSRCYAGCRSLSCTVRDWESWLIAAASCRPKMAAPSRILSTVCQRTGEHSSALQLRDAPLGAPTK